METRFCRSCCVLMLKSLLTVIWLLSFVKCRNDTAQGRLYNDLLKDYHKYELPVRDVENFPLRLSFVFELIKIYELNAKKQRMSIVLVLNQQWNDYHLRWNSSQYNGFSSLNIPPSKIWVPDLGLYNEIANKDHKKTDITVKVVVRSDGRCRWSIPMLIQVLCSVDVTFFPMDHQHCTLTLGSLVYPASDIMIEKGQLANSSRFIRNGEWSLSEYAIKTKILWDDIRHRDFSVAEVTLKLERNSAYYLIEMFVPCFLISGLTILGFVIPAESGERMSLGMLIMLAMTFFQQLTMRKFPLQDFPLISKYFFVTTLEIGVALFFSTLTINFYYCKGRKMPKLMKTIIHKYLGRITRLGPWAVKKEPRMKPSYRFTNNHSVNNHSANNMPQRCDIELAERRISPNSEPGDETLDSSSIGLVLHKRHSSFTSSRSSSYKDAIIARENDHDDVSDSDDDSPEDWNDDWVLASKIIDRFAAGAAIFIGAVTILGLFLQAPSVG